MIVEKFDKNKNQKTNNSLNKKIRNVYILDASSSMFNSKYPVMYDSINKELDAIYKKELELGTETSIRILEFTHSTYDNLIEGPLSTTRLPNRTRTSGGNTPLYRTIINVYREEISKLEKDTLLVFQILTDGGEYDYNSPYNINDVKDLIQNSSKNVLFTACCTKQDLNTILLLGIDKSNINIHDNSKKGMEKFSNERGFATMSMMVNYKAGIDVSRGYYNKNIVD